MGWGDQDESEDEDATPLVQKLSETGLDMNSSTFSNLGLIYFRAREVEKVFKNNFSHRGGIRSSHSFGQR